MSPGSNPGLVRNPDYLDHVSVVLPCRNEVTNIGTLIQNLLFQGFNCPQCQILVIDDQSCDGSREYLSELNNLGLIDLICTEHRLGLGKSILCGIRSAKNSILAIMDTDGIHNPNYLPWMIHYCKRNFDLVIGSRYTQGGNMNGAIYPKLSRGVNFIIQKLMGSKVRDQLCGFFVARREELLRLPETYFEGFGEYFVAVINSYESRGAKIVEVPTTHTIRLSGERKSRRIRMFFNYLIFALRIKKDKL